VAPDTGLSLRYCVTFDVHRAVRRSIISIVNPTRCTNVSNLFYFGMTLHVSDGLSVHHQEFKTVHTATGICQADIADSLLAGTGCSFSSPLASSQQYLFDIYKFDTLVHLVGFTIEIIMCDIFVHSPSITLKHIFYAIKFVLDSQVIYSL